MYQLIYIVFFEPFCGLDDYCRIVWMDLSSIPQTVKLLAVDEQTIKIWM